MAFAASVCSRTMSTLQKLATPSSFTKDLRPDHAIPTVAAALENSNNVTHKPRILKDGAFSWSLPEERKAYMYMSSSPQALADLGLDRAETDSEEYRQIVSGQAYHDPKFQEKGLPVPYAQAYAGWQFGQFAGQLGDGRVHTLFEVAKPASVNSPSCEHNRRKYELQLKGSGMTPFSRFADGKAVLRSSIREYIISEHLNAIGIPTTRALSLTYLPKTFAQRYGAEKCAIVSRFAESWVRIGTFDLYRWRADVDGCRSLSDYVISQLFSEGRKFPVASALLDAKPEFLQNASTLGALTDYDRMYLEIVVRNANTCAMWQAYGFLNGVLNTDNTSVLGLSMDFGPFAIMDRFDAKFTPNAEDHQLRYSYGNTPSSLWWNLARLGEDLAYLIGAGEKNLAHGGERLMAKAEDDEFADSIAKRASKVIEMAGELYQYSYTKKYVETFFRRLRLPTSAIGDADQQNEELIEPLLNVLQQARCDFNLFFLKLQEANVGSGAFDADAFAQSVVPKDIDPHENYDENDAIASIKTWVSTYQQYAQRVGWGEGVNANPKFLPRGWILNEVIAKTQESGGEDLSYLHKLEKMAFYPFEPEKWGDELKDVEKRWMLQGDMGTDYAMLQCSCSS